MLLFVRWYDKLFLDATIDGRRLPPLEISEFISIFYKIVVKKMIGLVYNSHILYFLFISSINSLYPSYHYFIKFVVAM